jgi:regulator of protease activity HflC (stomatin/prohibitin superfamily)
MGDPVTWVSTVVEYLKEAMPIRVVNEYQQGIRFTAGKAGPVKRHGVYLFLPIYQSFDIINTTREVINLPTQSLVTLDDIGVCVSGALEYRVRNARAYWLAVQDFDTSIVNSAMGSLSREVRGRTYQDNASHTHDLEGLVKDNLQKKVHSWGVNINDFYITDFVKAPSFRLFGDMNPGVRQ